MSCLDESMWHCENCEVTWDEADIAHRVEVDEIYYVCPDCEYDLLVEIKPKLSKREIDQVRADRKYDEMKDERVEFSSNANNQS